MTLDQWAAIGIVCGALLALFGVIAALWKGLPVVFRAFRKMNRAADTLLGDPEAGLPNLAEQVKQIRKTQLEQGVVIANQGRAIADQAVAQAEHLRWHGRPGGAPAGPPVPKSNDTGPTRQPPRKR